MPPHIRVIHSTLVAAAIALAVMSFPQISETTKHLSQAGSTLFSKNALLDHFVKMATPHAGENVLPLPVQSMLSLVREHRLPSYRYSPQIASQEETRQRLLESSLPVRYHPEAHYLILLSGEPVPAECSVLESREGVTLASCR